MQQIRMVDIEDVYPLEDEYGNKIAQRDLDSKANQKYIKELASTFRDGIPDTPPILVEDGGIYRIKDGNCRISAMRTLGTKRFPAIIDDEGTEQAIVETVLRTNCKKKYEPVEESRFVQQLALLNADDYAVAKVAGVEPEKIKRIRKGVKLAGDACEDMSLDRLLAIEEFIGDDEVVEHLISMPEKEFPRYYEECIEKRARKERVNAILDALKKRGIKVCSSYPDNYTYLETVGNASSVVDLPDDCIVKHDEWSEYFFAYVPSETKTNPYKEMRKAWIDEQKIELEKDLRNRIEWLKQAVLTTQGKEDLRSYAEGWLDDQLSFSWPKDIAEFPEYEVSTGDIFMAFLADTGNRKFGPYTDFFDGFMWATEYIDTLDTLIECGYDPTYHELETYGNCKDAIKDEQHS